MAQTPMAGARVPEEIVNAARQRHPELEGLTLSTMVRVAMTLLAGTSATVAEAVAASRMKPGPRSVRRHGTCSMYSGGCRCDECRAAHAADQRARVAIGRQRKSGAAA
jgi:hypothetical protein